MELINILAAKRSTEPNILELQIVAKLGSSESPAEEVPFTYDPADPYGLAPAVKAFFAANPSFPIADADPPPPPSTDDLHPPLDPWRFWAVVELSGITEAGLYAAIDAQPEASFRAIARAKLRNPPGGKYHRSDALFADAGLLTALNLTAATVDTLWSQAHALPA